MVHKTFFYAITVMAGIAITSCSSDNDVFSEVEQEQPTGKVHVRLRCSTGPQVYTRAALIANGKEITDLYIMDYDKASGKLFQILHQTSTATDFAEPDLTLDYGEHTLKVIATRSEAPTLLDALDAPWSVTDNILTPVTTSQPVVLTSNKTSDTFGAQQDVTVGIGMSNAVSITLDRLVAKLVIHSTDQFPDNCSTIEVSLDEHKAFSWQAFEVIASEKNQRVTDVSGLAGKTGTTISYFLLAPEDGYTTDITFTTNRKNGAPYSTITVPDVPFERNKVTNITGSFYNHQQGFTISLNDEWSAESNDINI